MTLIVVDFVEHLLSERSEKSWHRDVSQVD